MHTACHTLARPAALPIARPHLDELSIRYWEGRDLVGRRRINGFARGLYKRGLLGNFIGLAHLIARLHRVDPRQFLTATTVEEQRAIFEAKFAPFFDRSEEHTSELQSLMRISYAVFCLKKKTNQR